MAEKQSEKISEEQPDSGVEFETNPNEGSVLTLAVPNVGSWWSWAEGKTENLYDIKKKALTDLFVSKVQPVFDSYGLGVVLRGVKIQNNDKRATNETIGYDMFLKNITGTEISFVIRLGTLLHELGHVVQFVNVPREKWQGLTSYSALDKDGLAVTVARSDWDARVKWMNDENGLNVAEFKHMYHNDDLRYEQDAYLKAMSLADLASLYLLVGGYSLDAPCNRFRDLLLALPKGRKP